MWRHCSCSLQQHGPYFLMPRNALPALGDRYFYCLLSYPPGTPHLAPTVSIQAFKGTTVPTEFEGHNVTVGVLPHPPPTVRGFLATKIPEAAQPAPQPWPAYNPATIPVRGRRARPCNGNPGMETMAQHGDMLTCASWHSPHLHAPFSLSQGTDVLLVAPGSTVSVLEADLVVCGGAAVVHIINDTLRWIQSTVATAAATDSAALVPRAGEGGSTSHTYPGEPGAVQAWEAQLHTPCSGSSVGA